MYVVTVGQQGIEIPVEMNGTSLLMELDTGAGVSVISEETYKKHFSGTPLRPSKYSPTCIHRTPTQGTWATYCTPKVPRPER